MSLVLEILLCMVLAGSLVVGFVLVQLLLTLKFHYDEKTRALRQAQALKSKMWRN